MKEDLDRASRKRKRGLGRLYKRDAQGQEHAFDAAVHGAFWAENRVGGRRVRQALRDEDGAPFTALRKAPPG